MEFRIEKTDCRSGEYMFKHKRLKNHIGDLLQKYNGRLNEEDDRFITISLPKDFSSFNDFFQELNKEFVNKEFGRSK